MGAGQIAGLFKCPPLRKQCVFAKGDSENLRVATCFMFPTRCNLAGTREVLTITVYKIVFEYPHPNLWKVSMPSYDLDFFGLFNNNIKKMAVKHQHVLKPTGFLCADKK